MLDSGKENTFSEIIKGQMRCRGLSTIIRSVGSLIRFFLPELDGTLKHALNVVVFRGNDRNDDHDNRDVKSEEEEASADVSVKNRER